MSDLISRSMYKSKLLKELDILNKEYREAILNEDNDLILAIQNKQSAYMIALRLLDNEPIAYSVDKVVEELKCDRCESCNFLEVCAGSKCCGKCHDKAIEIVKHGGVADNVCEWEKGFSGYVGYPAYYSKCCTTNSKGLEMQTHIIADWKYCPYCGKKIKIVGD